MQRLFFNKAGCNSAVPQVKFEERGALKRGGKNMLRPTTNNTSLLLTKSAWIAHVA